MALSAMTLHWPEREISLLVKQLFVCGTEGYWSSSCLRRIGSKGQRWISCDQAENTMFRSLKQTQYKIACVKSSKRYILSKYSEPNR